MKEYTNDNPTFSKAVEILETTDTNHADNFNVATKKLFDNTQVLKGASDKIGKSVEALEETVGKFEGFSYDNQNETLIVPATVGSVVGETLVLAF